MYIILKINKMLPSPVLHHDKVKLTKNAERWKSAWRSQNHMGLMEKRHLGKAAHFLIHI